MHNIKVSKQSTKEKKTAKKTNTHTNWNQTEHKDIKRKNKTTPTTEQNQIGKQKRKITDMQIKVWKETTKAEPHTFKSSFAFKLEKETNENVTTKK